MFSCTQTKNDIAHPGICLCRAMSQEESEHRRKVRISLIRSIRTDAALETTVKAEKRFTTCPEKVNEEVIEQHFVL